MIAERGAGAILASLMALLFACAAAAAEAGWGDYTNARFQYRICYPTDVFVEQLESPNGDGRRFVAQDGPVLTVYGRNNVLDEPPDATARQIAARLAGAGGKTTYSAIHSGSFAVSGQHGPQIFYAKGLLKDQQYKIFEITYPAALARKYNRIVEKIAACFGDTGG